MQIKNTVKNYVDRAIVNNKMKQLQTANWRDVPSANIPYNINYKDYYHGNSFIFLGIDGNNVYMADAKERNNLKSSLVCVKLQDFESNPFPSKKSCGKMYNVENGKLILADEQTDIVRAKNLTIITKKPLDNVYGDKEEKLIHKIVKYSLIKFAESCALRNKKLLCEQDYLKLQKELISSAEHCTGDSGLFSSTQFVYKHTSCFIPQQKERSL